MSRRDLEATNRFFAAASIMREQQQQHCNGFPSGTLSLTRRHSSLSTASKEKPSQNRTQRSNSSSGVVHPHGSLPLPSRGSYDSSKRRPSLAIAPKQKDSPSNALEQYSLVMLGVGGVGKTVPVIESLVSFKQLGYHVEVDLLERRSLVVRYVTGRFLHEYDPTLEMTYEKELHIGENAVSLAILDTAGNGQASYIQEGDGFIVVYSITDYYSFEVARQLIKLIKEVRRTDDVCQVPIVLVGNKHDSRRGRSVSKNEAREVASEYGCSHYETSALTNRNVQVVFYNMVFQVRFTKASNKESKKSQASPTGPHNGFLNSVKQLFYPAGRLASRRASLPS